MELVPFTRMSERWWKQRRRSLWSPGNQFGWSVVLAPRRLEFDFFNLFQFSHGRRTKKEWRRANRCRQEAKGGQREPPRTSERVRTSGAARINPARIGGRCAEIGRASR